MDHRRAVGGLWDEIGELGFRFLVDHGLEPKHRFLDIGCGSARIGRHLSNYLDMGRYYGIDRDRWLLDAAKWELPARGAHLFCDDQFSFDKFGDVTFDMAFAQSVFTHLPLPEIHKCLRNLRPFLDGPLYATHFRPGYHHPVVTYDDRDPWHHYADEIACEGWTLNDIGDWGHPRGQGMLELRPVR